MLAVRDADYGAFVWTPQDPRLDAWMDLYQSVTSANGADANAGRHLASWVHEAGFDDPVVSSSNWTYHTDEERTWWGELWADRVRYSAFADQARTFGLADESALQEIADAFLDWSKDDEGFFIVVNVEVLARR